MSRIIRNILVIILILISIYSFRKLEKREIPNCSFIPQNDLKVEQTIIRKEPFILSPLNLAIHFPDEQVSITPREMVEMEILTKPDDGPVTFHNWKYISTIIQNNTSYYYFKNSRSNQILEMSLNKMDGSWTLLSVESDSFILQFGETIFKVMKK